MKRAARHGIWLLVAGGWLVAAAVHRDYGVTWDEGVQARYGELALGYFRSGFQDTRCNEYLDLRFYGPLFEMVPAAVDGSPTRYETRHLVLGLLAVLALPAVALYGRLFRVPWLPSLAVLALLAQPRFVGHAFNNSKDLPFAVTTAWFLLAAAWWALRPAWRGPACRGPACRGSGRKALLACGLALGLAAAARPAGMPLLVVYLAGVVALASWRRGREADEPASRRTLWLGVPLAVAVGWLVMVLPWPWAHGGPLGRPWQAMRASASVATSYPVLFEGEVVASRELPWYYLAKYLLITLPPTVLVLALAGLGFALRWLIVVPRRRRSFLAGVTLWWLAVPVAAFLIARPNVYDGLRHFLFVLPAIAVLAAIGGAGLLEVGRTSPSISTKRRLLWLAVLVALALPLVDVAALHPYQMTYFNGLVGGLDGAAGRYETDYWISSYREAMLWINAQAARRGDGVVRVLVAGAEGDYARPAAEYYAARHVEVVTPWQLRQRRLPPSALDFYLATTRYGLDRAFDGPVVHSVGRRGAVFAVVRRVGAPPYFG